MVRKPPAELPVDDDPLEPLGPRSTRRTWPQRIVLALGVVLSTAAVAVAAAVGWGAWKLTTIDRTDVAVDDVVAGGARTYLIVGSDTRSGGDPNDPTAEDDHAPLADTIMLLRIDPEVEGARLLSLPRDLWVTHAGTGEEGRINAAYAQGGPQRLIDTLKAELDVPINHYVEVDFAGFQQLVEAIGGVPMWFDRAMRDRNSGLEVLHPGCTTLDGYGALAFARARHLEYFEDGGFTADGTGDLGRISRQQLFLRRVIDRAKAKGISNPLTLKKLVEVGADSITIDRALPVSELLALGRQYSSFDSGDLETFTLPVTPRTTSGGAAVVDLVESDAEPILELFRDDPAPSSRSGADEPTTTTSVAPEEIGVTVLNSAGREGLAVEVADGLVAQGFDVEHWGNGAELGHDAEPATVVRHGRGAGAEAATVAAAAGGASVEADPTLEAGEVVLFLGRDFDELVAVDQVPSSTATASTTASSVTTTAPIAAPAEQVGMVPEDPPPGESCG